VPSVALLALCFGFLWYLASSSAELPDRVANHFDFGGEPNGWMSRQAAWLKNRPGNNGPGVESVNNPSP
jgi:hypothetical protein